MSLYYLVNVFLLYLLLFSFEIGRSYNWLDCVFTGSLAHTAIPYRVSTGLEQGFPCVVFPHREKPVFSSWDPCNENRIFPVGNTTQGKPCSHYRDGFAV